MRLRLDELVSSFPPPGGQWERHVFWGDDGLAKDFWEQFSLQGLFAQAKVLIVRQAQNLPAEQWKALSAALGSVAGTVWPIICLEVDSERGKPKVPAHIQKLACYGFAEKKGWLEVIPGLDSRSLPGFVLKAAKALGLNMTPQEAQQLAGRLLPDAALVQSDLAKLALLADHQGRLPKNAASLLEHNQDIHIFEMIASIQNNTRQAAVWRQILDERLGGDVSVFGFMKLLQREARVLWQVLHNEPSPLPPSVLGQKRALAQGLGPALIARIFDLLLTAEKGIKTGERSPEQSFDKLAADLFTLFSQRSRR